MTTKERMKIGRYEMKIGLLKAKIEAGAKIKDAEKRIAYYEHEIEKVNKKSA